MRSLVLFSLLLLSFTAHTQSIPANPNLTDANGWRQGKWTIWFDADWGPTANKDSLAYYRVIEYKDDKPVGLVRDYYLNGVRQFEGQMLVDRPTIVFNDTIRYYREDGTMESAEVYRDGKSTGEYFNYKTDGSLDLTETGFSYYNNEAYAKAEKYLLLGRAEAEEKQGKMSKDYAEACSLLGWLYRRTGDYEKAGVNYQESQVAYKASLGENSREYINSFGNIADLYAAQGLYSKAEPLTLEAMQRNEAAFGRLTSSAATYRINMAAIYMDMGRMEKAETLLLDAKEIVLKVLGESSPYYARVCNNLALVYMRQKKFEKALDLLLRAKKMRVEFGESIELANTCINLESVYKDTGRYPEAEAELLEAERIVRKLVGTEHRTYSTVCNNLASLYRDMGQYQRAVDEQSKALQIAEKLKGFNKAVYSLYNMNMANYCKALQQYDRAEAYYLKAQEGYFWVIDNQFSYLSEKEKEELLKTFLSSFESFHTFFLKRREENPAIVATVYNNLLVTKAILFNTQNKIRNNILNSGDAQLIQTYQHWQQRRNYLARAYQMTDKQKTSLGINTVQMEEEINQLEKILSARSELFSKASDKRRYTWKDVQKTLKSKEAAIEMVRFRISDGKKFTDSIYYAALIVTPGAPLPEFVVFNNGNAMEKALTKYRNSIRFSVKDDQSYAMFWQPIADRLKSIAPKTRKIYFSADGVYHSINLLTLQNPPSGKYVTDEFDIQLVTNTKDLVEKVPFKGKGRNALLFGYPDYGGDRATGADSTRGLETNDAVLPTDSLSREFSGGIIPMLPGTEREIVSLKRKLETNQWEVESLLLNQATEDKVKTLQNPRVLHIATHGFFMGNAGSGNAGFAGFDSDEVSKNPLLRSGLLLAGSQQALSGAAEAGGEDGILTAYEAMSLNLDQTELVVLSACETGLGQLKNGEGVFGLQRALQTAGAKTVVMSLWKVSDESTQQLMEYFYDYWLSSGDKRKAFRQAQIAMRSKYKDPYHWGAFVMVGH